MQLVCSSLLGIVVKQAVRKEVHHCIPWLVGVLLLWILAPYLMLSGLDVLQLDWRQVRQQRVVDYWDRSFAGRTQALEQHLAERSVTRRSIFNLILNSTIIILIMFHLPPKRHPE
jgi:hypothetical protein